MTQTFTVPGNEVITNTHNSWCYQEKIIQDIAAAPDQSVLSWFSLMINLFRSTCSGPLPLNFTDYHIKAVYIDYRMKIEYAALLCAYRDKIRDSSVGYLSTESTRIVFQSCPNLRTFWFIAEDDLERAA